MLVVTGGEAMYADMGHFGSKPIRLSWFSLTYPALLLNYFKQGAFLLSGQPVLSNNIFFSMVPSWGLYPMIGLATLATIIASQALITGAFSLTTQAMSLGLIPYLNARHTHDEHEGQIYVPAVNWALYIGCMLLVIGFQTSSNLASTYGLAVSVWKWGQVKSLAVFIPLAVIDGMFLFANSLKILQGGYVPLLIGVVVLAVMKTWLWGRQFVKKTYTTVPTMTVDELIKYKEEHDVSIPRSIFILTPEYVNNSTSRVPFLKQIFWERYGLLPKHLVFLTVSFIRQPHVDDKSRFEVHELFSSTTKGSITSVKINFGFMEERTSKLCLKNLQAIISSILMKTWMSGYSMWPMNVYMLSR